MAGLLEQKSNKTRKKVVSKNINGQSREYAALTRNHWNHKHWALRRGDVTFSARVKASAACAERSIMVKAEVRRIQEDQGKLRATGGVDEVRLTRAGNYLDRTEGTV